MKPVFQFIVLILVVAVLEPWARSDEIRLETDGFRGEVPNGLTSKKPFLKLHVEPNKQSRFRTVPFVRGQMIQNTESLLRTIRSSVFMAKRWPTERPTRYEALCLPSKAFIRREEFYDSRAHVKKLVFKEGDRLTLLQYFSEGNAIAKIADEACFLNLADFTVSPEPEELPDTENWIKVESVTDPGEGSWLLIDDNIECL